jgi:prepilin-type N-terminal cleavage/methylation domain-containing protein
MRSSFRSGFTLIELMVSVTIIIVLASLALPMMFKVMTQVRILRCANNLRTIGIAANVYAGDCKGYFPPSFSNPNCYLWMKDSHGQPHGLGFLVDGYLEQKIVLACPEFNLNNPFGYFPSVVKFTSTGHTGYQYRANTYGNANIDRFLPENIDSGCARGPDRMPQFYYGISHPSSSRVVIAYDTISDNLNPKFVNHPHPRDNVARMNGLKPGPGIKGGNVLCADGHVRFLLADNWIQNGAYGTYIPYSDL